MDTPSVCKDIGLKNLRLWQKVNFLVKGFKVYVRTLKSNKTDRQTKITRLYNDREKAQ